MRKNAEEIPSTISVQKNSALTKEAKSFYKIKTELWSVVFLSFLYVGYDDFYFYYYNLKLLLSTNPLIFFGSKW